MDNNVHSDCRITRDDDGCEHYTWYMQPCTGGTVCQITSVDLAECVEVDGDADSLEADAEPETDLSLESDTDADSSAEGSRVLRRAPDGRPLSVIKCL